MPKIRTNRGEVFDAHNESILQVLRKNGIYLPASCGGKGVCGRCKIKIKEGTVRTESIDNLSEKEKEEGFVLACLTYCESDLYVDLPEKLITVEDRISKIKAEYIEKFFKDNPELYDPPVKRVSLSLYPPSLEDSRADFESLFHILGKRLNVSPLLAGEISRSLRDANWRIQLAVSESDILHVLQSDERIYGIAIDIGTTTVVLCLVDMEEGKVKNLASCYNSQISYGDDVITRIIFSVENPDGLHILRNSIMNDLNALLETLEKKGKILFGVISGNTTMCHIFWGLNPEHIRVEPYVPIFSRYPIWKAHETLLNIKNSAPLYTLPSVAGFVGGDIVAGVLFSGMYESEEVCLFIDIGTNGEIVLGNREFLLTASTSAGPCFEGSGISCGMRATEGAVESFQYFKDTDSFKVKVIGNRNCRGICGSGMIDILYELYKSEVIDKRGRFVPDSSSHLSRVNDEWRFLINETCYITQSDLDNIIRAKAAIYAGVETLLREVGMDKKDIQKVYIAGGFGEFLDVKKAISIGMIPNLPVEKYSFLGNSSLAGAVMCLLSNELREKAEEIAKGMTYIDLSSSKFFMDEYVASLFIPHTDESKFIRFE